MGRAARVAVDDESPWAPVVTGDQGQRAAEEEQELDEGARGSDMVFITAMGGGTGSGAAPVITGVDARIWVP